MRTTSIFYCFLLCITFIFSDYKFVPRLEVHLTTDYIDWERKLRKHKNLRRNESSTFTRKQTFLKKDIQWAQQMDFIYLDLGIISHYFVIVYSTLIVSRHNFVALSVAFVFYCHNKHIKSYSDTNRLVSRPFFSFQFRI